MAEEKKVIETEKKAASVSDSLGMQTIVQAQTLQGMFGVSVPEHYPRVVGLQSSKRRDGTGYSYNLFLEEEFNEYDLQRGQCIGIKTSIVYVRDVAKIPPELKLGDHIKVSHVARGNYVVVDEIRIMN